MLSGSGQASPAPSARFNVSRTVERARPSRRAISCADKQENFSRMISRASRIPIRSAGIDPPLGLPKGRPDQANGGARQSTNDPGRDHSVMGGAIISESGGGIIPLRGAASSRNWGAASSGISSLTPSSCRSPLGQSTGSLRASSQANNGFGDVPTLSTRHQRFTRVRLTSAHLTSFPRLFRNAHYPAVVPAQLAVVWTLILQSGSKGPALISCAARLLRVGFLSTSEPPLRAVMAPRLSAEPNLPS